MPSALLQRISGLQVPDTQQFSSREFWNWGRRLMRAYPHCITDFDSETPSCSSKKSWSCSVQSVPTWKYSEEWQFGTARRNGGSADLLVSAHLVIYALRSPVTVLGSQVLPDNRTSWNCAVLRLINLSDGTQLSWERIKPATRAAEQPSQLCWFTQNDALQGVFTA